VDPNDPLNTQYGDYPLIQSQEISGRKWLDVGSLGSEHVGQKVLVRARIHNTRGKGKSAFIVLRQKCFTVQCVLFADDQTVSKGMVKFASNIPKESIVDVEGLVVAPEQAVEGCSQQIELAVTFIKVVSRAVGNLPFELVDAARPESDFEKDDQLARVLQDTRLDNRAVDLRTPANQAIFQTQSGVCQLFRECLLSMGFTEIHTPKLIAGSSEGGAEVFKLDYMGMPGCLAQSPQLYKQMAMMADLERVFEIGPVFRAEKSNTHRHLCEFTGLDFEMAIHEHYMEVLDVLDQLFIYIFDGLNQRYKRELKVIGEQYPFEPLEYCRPSLRLEFAEGIRMLQAAGVEVEPLGDLNTEQERTLGRLVKEKYKTDFYMLHRYPYDARPFYTMRAPDNPDYTNSFDLFIRGEEIISGAQRVHDPDLIAKQAVEKGLEVETIKDYIDSFKLGAPCHGGCGVGLERVVMLFAGLDNIRKTSMFPRTPQRLTP